MDLLFKLLFRNPWKLENQLERLKEHSNGKPPHDVKLIPLDAVWGILQVILAALLFVAGFCLLCGTWIVISDEGLSMNLFYVTAGFGIPTVIFLFMFCNTDSRYVLDLENQRLIFVFTFFIKIYQRSVATFSEIVSVELDAEEGGSRSEQWRYYLVIVKKNDKRIRITPDKDSSETLPEVAKLIANIVGCSHKDGIAFEKQRIMGM